MAQKQFIIDGGFKTNADSVIEGNLELSGNKITGLGAAVAASDAVNKSTLEAAISNVDVTAELAVVTSAYQAADDAEETARIAGDAATLASAQTYADTAEADAVASAEAKDVVRAAAANAYADQAEVDAVASEEAKDVVRATEAASDATTKADAAQSAAEATAASDATSKANAAQAAAISTAGTDATTKANAAQSAATTAAASDATAKADAALVSAKAYSDLSENASNAYTDSELAALINAAPGSLDTLNELAAAMGDDANFAASTATNIATAKGEAIATASSDATSKANAAQSAAISAAASDATSKANAAQAAAIAAMTHFHSSVTDVTAANETSNATATVNFTFSELTNAKHYVVLLNRNVMRPSEYSVSGTTVTGLSA